jgi:hypothetical protein
LLTSPESLCFQVLKLIYFPNDDLLNSIVGNNPSKSWRDICEGIEVLKHGLIKRIGDDKSTKIWECNWIPRATMLKPICSKVPNPPTLVSELIDYNSMTWKSDVVRHYFNHFDSDGILHIPLSLSKQEDC